MTGLHDKQAEIGHRVVDRSDFKYVNTKISKVFMATCVRATARQSLKKKIFVFWYRNNC